MPAALRLVIGPLAFAAMGQAIVIISGGIDLSIGAMMSLVNVLAATEAEVGEAPEAAEAEAAEAEIGAEEPAAEQE